MRNLGIIVAVPTVRLQSPAYHFSRFTNSLAMHPHLGLQHEHDERPAHCTQTDRQTDGRTDGRTGAKSRPIGQLTRTVHTATTDRLLTTAGVTSSVSWLVLLTLLYGP